MKLRTLILIVAALAASGCQQADQQEAAAPQASAPQAGPPPMGDPADNPDMTGFAAEVDADGNGEMSREEWQAKGLPNSSFDMFEKGRGFVTLKDYQENAAPPGIDMDGDGKVTVAEFVAFDKKMSANMPPPGGDGPPKQ
ncbi:MAG: hypothetical protein R3D89_05085 [Sphingomonadaceae bacterium]